MDRDKTPQNVELDPRPILFDTPVIYLTGIRSFNMQKTLGWWLIFSLFAAVVGVTYLRTLDISPPGSVTAKTNATYDYVIVGGGTAGCVLATRLSEDPRNTVLLLEAGGEESEHLWNHVPLWNPIKPGSDSDWGHYTVPQKYACKAFKNQKCPFINPRILGGSSLSSEMLYTRGSRHGFSFWPDDENRTWKYENVLPYFLKSEDILIESLKLSDYHSSRGPLPVSGPPPEISDLYKMFMAAGRELKYKTLDCNGREGTGFCHLHVTTRDGQRFSTARDYLRTAMNRNNIHVSTHSIVIKVLLSKHKAVGVEYVKNGQKRTVGATKDIILSAGVVGTPHLLMLSGVGPRAHLEKMGVPVVADLPVGSNLQDHVTFRLDVVTNTSLAITREWAFNPLSYLQYFLMGKGVLASSDGLFGHALLKSDANSNHPAPDLQITFSALSEDLTVYDKSQAGNVPQPTINRTSLSEGFSIFIELLRPESRGTVRLLNNNPLTAPVIDPLYLVSQKDIQTLIKGIKMAVSILSTTPFRAVRARLTDKPYSPCIQYRIKSDAYWECVVRHQAIGSGQATSTCSMKASDSERPVVETNLKVKGIDNLRVVDGSVIPTSVSGDVTPTKIMVAEKSSDLIRGFESVRWYRRLSEQVLKNL